MQDVFLAPCELSATVAEQKRPHGPIKMKMAKQNAGLINAAGKKQ
jgi:hypothetical protein